MAPHKTWYKTTSPGRKLLSLKGEWVAMREEQLQRTDSSDKRLGLTLGRTAGVAGSYENHQFAELVAQEIDTMRSMRKEDFQRRAAEMRARMLARSNERVEQSVSTPVRTPRTRRGQEDRRITSPCSKADDIRALQKRIKELETENQRLREQLVTANRATPYPQPVTDSVREQRYNFFKYSNLRRY
jgi:hypothetical protein